MLPYLIHASILVAGSYFFYTLFLGKETFFSLNRWVLIGCILAAFALPFLEIPEEWSIRNNENIISHFDPISGMIPMPESKSKTPKEIITQPIDNQLDNQRLSKQKINKKSQKNNLKWGLILKYIYLTGLIIFTLNLLIQLIILIFKIIRNSNLKDGAFRIVELNQDVAPFSFLNVIFINPSKYDWETYNQIIEHEKIHIKGRHTLDIFIAEMMVIIQWFNPFAWLYRKAIEHNLEYLTDLKMLKEGTNRKAYQMNLLKVSVPNLPLNLTTNYNQSILKKRILMMNAKKSSVRSSWKYFFLLPALGLSVICLNTVKTSAQLSDFQKVEKQIIVTKAHDPNNEQNDDEKLIIDTGDAYIVAQGMTIYNDEMPTNGNWTAEIDGNEICIQFKSEKIQGNWWARNVCYEKTAFSDLNTSGSSSFILKREAGTISFEGKFDGNKGEGTFSFTENAAFKSYLVSQGFMEVNEKTMFQFALSNLDKSYITFMRDQGYEPSLQELKSLAVHGSSKEKVNEYIDKSKKLGIEKITLKDIMQFETHEINMDYVLEMKDLLKEDLSAKDVVQAGIHDLSPDYIKSIMAEGYPNMTFKQVVQFGIHDIEANYIKELKAAGLTNLDSKEIVQAAIHDIGANYIKELKGAGFEGMSFDEIVQFGIHDIDGEYIKQIRNSGLDLTNKQMVQAAIHDIDANYIKELKGAGFEGMSFDEVVQFGIHDIDADYVKELKNSGLDLNTNQMVQAAIHDISAESIKELKAAGYEGLTFNDIVQFGIHDINANYIRDLQAAGLNNLTTNEIVQAAIHNVQAKEISEFRSMGYQLDIQEIIQFSIHDVNAEYIGKMKQLGFEKASHQDLIQAAIHDVGSDFIKKARSEGKNYNSLQEYIQLKVNSYDNRNRRKIE